MTSRLQSLQKLLKKENIDAAFISSLPNICYLTGFSGFSTEDRDAYLLITRTKRYIFTHGIYKEAVKKEIPNFDLVEIRRENPISNAVKTVMKKHKLTKIGFEAFDLTVNEYERLTKQVSKKMLFPLDLIGELRTNKSPDEIQAIKKACQLGDKAYSYILKHLRTGITEKQITIDLEYFIECNNADVAFPTIVAFGPHASNPHHVPTAKKLTENTLVLIDFGVRLHDYCSDMTRTIFFGKTTKKQKNAYETVLAAQNKAIGFITSSLIKHKSPVSASKIDKVVREYIISQGFPSMPHSLGHGIGLEVHEAPRLTSISKEKLQPGNVFSIEPGIYLPGEFGIRIEDLFAIKNNKLIQLTKTDGKIIEL